MAKGPRSRRYAPKEPLTALTGINVTASEQDTKAGELSGGQNVFTDVTGAVYARQGSSVLGGVAGITGCQGGFVFRDNNQRYALVAVVLGKIYAFDGAKMALVAGSPTLDTTLQVNGCFYPDVNKYYLTNGTDSVVELDMSTGNLTATSKPAMQKSLYLGYLDHHLYFLNLPSQPNAYALSDQGAVTMNAASVVAAQGYVMGLANLDNYNGVLLTDQMAYRLGGTVSTYDATGNLVFAPASALPIGKSRCVAPRSILYLNNAVYWIGLDDFNVAEVYRTDGQTIRPVAWVKMKYYLRQLNGSALGNACATQYGYYAKFAVPAGGSATNNWELLLDTARSVSYTESGTFGPPQIIWEPVHVPTYSTAQYATWRSGGQEYVVSFDQDRGMVRLTNQNQTDEVPLINAFPAAGSSPTYGSVSVTTSVSLDQPYTPAVTVPVLGFALAVSAYSAATGTCTFQLQSDSAGIPSGTVLASATVTVTTAGLPPVISASLAQPYTLLINTPYHVVVTISTGTLTVTKSTPQLLAAPYKTGASSSWTNGTGNPVLLLTQQAPIDASAIWTTNLENPYAKKRIIRTLINGTSLLTAQLSLGVGSQGRLGQFTETPFALIGSSAVWSPPSSPPANALTWANPGDAASSTNSWAGASSNFEDTVPGPWYVSPSHYLSIRIRGVTGGDWRINSMSPVAGLTPTTIA